MNKKKVINNSNKYHEKIYCSVEFYFDNEFL